MKEDKEEKKLLFEGFPFKEMTDKEFDQWAENHVNTYNSFVKAYKSGDPRLSISEIGGDLAFEVMSLILIRFIFSGEEIREVTKEEVLEKYSYLRDKKYLSELEKYANKLIDNLSYLKL